MGWFMDITIRSNIYINVHPEGLPLRSCKHWYTLPLPSQSEKHVPIQLCLLEWRYYRSIWRRTVCWYLKYLTFLLPICVIQARESISHTTRHEMLFFVYWSADSHLVPGKGNGHDTDVVRRYVGISLIRKCQYSYFCWLPTPRDSNISRISMWFLMLNERNLQMEGHILTPVEREPASVSHILLLVHLPAALSWTVL